MSNDCTSGMPAVIIVASWREKIAMSPAVTLPCLRNSMLCLRTRVGDDALAAQLRADRGLARRDDLALDLFAGPVRAFPRERSLGRGCGCHSSGLQRERVFAAGPSAAHIA